ncbi:MAG TPA: hypothetical protein VJY62_15045 [Bacteroidia bacterium]|nr:hypothetical protein [Bacteroidia bacterium]
MLERLIKINKEQKVYVLSVDEKHYSCLGFEIMMKRAQALAEEMNEKVYAKRIGTKKAYKELCRLIGIARRKNKLTGWRSQAELYKPFIDKEGQRVEVEYTWGEKEKFYIGKSTGFIPCHLTIKKSNSTGGAALLSDSIKSYRFIN